jgi:hypothetical protein
MFFQAGNISIHCKHVGPIEWVGVVRVAVIPNKNIPLKK